MIAVVNQGCLHFIHIPDQFFCDHFQSPESIDFAILQNQEFIREPQCHIQVMDGNNRRQLLLANDLLL